MTSPQWDFCFVFLNEQAGETSLFEKNFVSCFFAIAYPLPEGARLYGPAASVRLCRVLFASPAHGLDRPERVPVHSSKTRGLILRVRTVLDSVLAGRLSEAPTLQLRLNLRGSA